VNWSRVLGAVVTACLLAVAAPARFNTAVARTHFLAQNQPAQRNSGPSQKGGNRRNQRPRARMGDWLRNHQNLPPEQQEKLLENDPNFKKLPPDRQAALKERLRKFNSLPPEQRERALARMQFMASLTPEQRKEIREANQKLEALPPERRVKVHAFLRNLRTMDPKQRQQLLQSEGFRSTFSEQEQELVKQLASIAAPAGGERSK
jgi:hypothetical protein